MVRNLTPRKRFFGGVAALALVVSLMAGAAQAQAQAPAAGGPGGKQGKAGKAGRRGEMGLNRRIAEQLNLTDAQKAKIQTLQKEARTKAQAIRADAKLSDEQKKAQAKDLMKATREKVEAVLTTEQKAKLKQIREEAKKNAAKTGKGGAGKAGKPTA